MGFLPLPSSSPWVTFFCLGKNIAELGEQWQKMLVEGCCDEEQEAEK